MREDSSELWSFYVFPTHLGGNESMSAVVTQQCLHCYSFTEIPIILHSKSPLPVLLG